MELTASKSRWKFRHKVHALVFKAHPCQPPTTTA